MSCDVDEVTERLENELLPLLHLRHSSFSNTSFASSTSQALHLTSPDEPPMLFPSHRGGSRNKKKLYYVKRFVSNKL